MMKGDVDWTLCFVADVEAAKGRNLTSLINKVVQSGATLVQLRGKRLKTREFLELALETSEILKEKNIPLIINDRVDIAISCEASGVHLGQEDLPLPYARKIMGKYKLIGISVNTVQEAGKAEDGGADYIGVGPIFFSPSKQELRPILGLQGLKTIRENVRIPILAIGGINTKNAREVIASGADGIAVISSLLQEKNISKATIELLKEMEGKKS